MIAQEIEGARASRPPPYVRTKYEGWQRRRWWQQQLRICGCHLLQFFAVLFGCQAWPAQCRSSHQPIKQQQAHHNGTVSECYTSDQQANGGGGGGYQTKIECPAAATGDDGDHKGTTKKLMLIFCTVKCYCHGNHDVCYCCQLMSSSGGPVCHDQLSDCQANCPICNPKCPPAPGSSFA